MQLSVEMSLYPLEEGYEAVILDFIARLKNYTQLKIEVNGMSTQVFGNYDEVMEILQREIKQTFASDTAMVMAMKLINSNRSI